MYLPPDYLALKQKEALSTGKILARFKKGQKPSWKYRDNPGAFVANR